MRPLENGEHLTRPEFERRYDVMPAGIKCELIDGVVYVSSPVKLEHSDPDSLLGMWLTLYANATPGTRSNANATLRLDEIAEPQPDQLLRVLPEGGGTSRMDEDGYLTGSAELVVEVAASRASYDLHQKKDLYLRHAVREYLVHVVHDAAVLWFALEEGDWVELEPDARGVVRSRVFPGLWLDTRALLEGDGARIERVLRRGIATKPHAAFVRDLKRAIARSRRRR
ncbi:MAG TPA: Uma2 family endonuclease [Planctomycetota bacterium]|nr:Uma2 family endonuclease [Planctomycetota bacterium]